jgi:hypothetical protein
MRHRTICVELKSPRGFPAFVKTTRFSAPNRPFLNPFLVMRDRNFNDGGYCGKQTLNGSEHRHRNGRMKQRHD